MVNGITFLSIHITYLSSGETNLIAWECKKIVQCKKMYANVCATFTKLKEKIRAQLTFRSSAFLPFCKEKIYTLISYAVYCMNNIFKIK